MSKAKRTKWYIIEKTAEIFNKKGFSGTSLTDLTSATQLTKGSIYGNFEAEEIYTVTVGSGLTDIWGDNLGFDYTFSFTGAPLSAAFRTATFQGGGVVFVNPDSPLISAQVVA